MKNLLACLGLAFLFSCSNGDTTTTTEGTPATAPVENVNGNIPDTTNSISPDNAIKTPDSSHLKDSIRGKDSVRK